MNGESKEDRDLTRFKLRVLVADDTVFNQQIIKRLLNKWGVEVKVVNNGKEAVTAFIDEEFDLIIMDVKMPEMDGFEATRKIREAEKKSGKHTPIIAMTASSAEEDKERCLASGMDGYVPKPLDSDQLYELIQSFVMNRRENQ